MQNFPVVRFQLRPSGWCEADGTIVRKTDPGDRTDKVELPLRRTVRKPVGEAAYGV